VWLGPDSVLWFGALFADVEFKACKHCHGKIQAFL
jgi:hypothetical protein